MIEVGKSLGRHIDFYIEEKTQIQDQSIKIENMVATQNVNTGRLLHYFPLKDKEDEIWGGWHKDFSLITGLVPGLYTNDQGEEVDYVDERAGLFIQKADTYEMYKLQIPKDCLAI
mmetsp:Transcript_33134/g.32262  ORF Transcript_33134/g.32262 Transcript_33134/m.32262 type:complete len:115 (+) Transcript_33134:171-515(+)|eukprot:CAMPEP_0170564036 /NCGR_PEP_ID=MMETSP0211-20121228/70480_1 /TAXON_ID=311385 /ORGANISM="Pseudokeronopsis sp., Strain OXSARD2" /LENGTH=114 /DNA_ID=CAMNT_0010882991 /DNA_START=46 /DNA_END=390 /DNA_ORIENTATION=-